MYKDGNKKGLYERLPMRIKRIADGIACNSAMAAPKAARINKGLSAEEVANKLNIGVKTLYKYEDGTSSPSILTALSMADLYGVPIDMLDFGVNDSSEKSNA